MEGAVALEPVLPVGAATPEVIGVRVTTAVVAGVEATEDTGVEAAEDTAVEAAEDTTGEDSVADE